MNKVHYKMVGSMRKNRKGHGKIPDRWEAYSNMGRQIPGTRFIPFKTPLKQELLKNFSSSIDQFGTRFVTDYCPKLGLVIDLTNTTILNRYYDHKDFINVGIQHEKIKVEGHRIPNNNVMNRFCKVVENFLKENMDNDKTIGIHCTHGLNRTGYVICRYMIQQLGVPPDQAINDFNSARGYAIERPNYLNDLRMCQWMKPNAVESPFQRFSLSGNSDASVPYDLSQKLQRSRASQSSVRSRLSSELNNTLTPPYNLGRHSDSFSGPSFQERAAISPENEIPKRLDTNSRKRDFSQIDDDYTEDLFEYENFESQNSSDSPMNRSFTSPKFGLMYYRQYYKDYVMPHYDYDYYSNRVGVGPQRTQRTLPLEPVGKNNKYPPRTYRGPRNYQSPLNVQNRSEFESASASGTSAKSSYTPYNQRDRKSNVFSPENENFSRRRSSRFQPY